MVEHLPDLVTEWQGDREFRVPHTVFMEQLRLCEEERGAVADSLKRTVKGLEILSGGRAVEENKGENWKDWRFCLKVSY